MVTELTATTIKESTKPIIIKAFATWCPHCAKMKPLYEALEKELGQKYLFTELDVDKFPELAAHYNILGLPTFVFVKNQKEVGRVIGEVSDYELRQKIDENL